MSGTSVAKESGMSETLTPDRSAWTLSLLLQPLSKTDRRREK